MPFCIKCADISCGDGLGYYSVSLSINSSVRPASCLQNDGSTTDDYIPGPATGTISLSAWAFEKDSKEKWLKSRCKGNAQASQTNITKYDFKTDQWYLIPSKIHKAQITGDLGDTVSLKTTFFTGQSAEAQNNNGTNITTSMETILGAVLTYSGPPLGLTIPDIEPYTISLGSMTINSAFINSININSDFPNPASIVYSFDFPLPHE